MDLDGGVGGPVRGFGGEELRHRGLLGERLAAILFCRRIHDHQARGLQINLTVGDHPLQSLKIRNGLPELLSLLGI